MDNTIVFVLYNLTRPISGGGDRRFALTSADDFDTAMINRYRHNFLSLRRHKHVGKC
ncbi:MAG: hypothetical protein FWE08_01555 [Oscillospiraceae bacterium]|nr:hypothetical protein [Oscillospiraceae bacterium]